MPEAHSFIWVYRRDESSQVEWLKDGEVLIAAGRNDNASRGRPLHTAALTGKAEACKNLLDDLKVDDIALNARDLCGRTALHLGALGGFDRVCQILLDHPRFQAASSRDLGDTCKIRFPHEFISGTTAAGAAYSVHDRHERVSYQRHSQTKRQFNPLNLLIHIGGHSPSQGWIDTNGFAHPFWFLSIRSRRDTKLIVNKSIQIVGRGVFMFMLDQ